MKTHSGLLSIVLAAVSSACGAAGTVDTGNEEEAPAVTEQKYTPVGRIVSFPARVAISRLENWGSGDSDVYTQKNRTYNVHIWTSSPYYQPGQIVTTVSYDVGEQYPDYTYLRHDQTAVIPIPDTTFRVNRVLSVASYLDLSERCPYNNCQYQHHWVDSNSSDYQLIRQADYYYDGQGPDDNGNANATLQLTVWLDVTDY